MFRQVILIFSRFTDFLNKQKAPNRAGALSGVWCSVVRTNYFAGLGLVLTTMMM